MSRKVQPKNISPLIKGARYTLLLAGWFYGVNKKALYTAIERRQKPLRLAAFEEEEKQKAIQKKEMTINELKQLFKDIELEPDPGWESDV